MYFSGAGGDRVVLANLVEEFMGRGHTVQLSSVGCHRETVSMYRGPMPSDMVLWSWVSMIHANVPTLSFLDPSVAMVNVVPVLISNAISEGSIVVV